MNSDSMTNQDDRRESLRADFLGEASQLLNHLKEDLLGLDQRDAPGNDTRPVSCDEAAMNTMFRSAHSLNALSTVLGLEKISDLTGQIESVFAAARKDERPLNYRTVEVISNALERAIGLVDLLKDNDSGDLDYEDVTLAVQDILKATGTEPEASDPPIDYFADVTDETNVPAKYMAIFIDESEMSLDSLADTLVSVESQEGDATTETLLITSHRIKGSAASLGLNRPAKLAHLMEDILHELRDTGGLLTPEMTDVMLRCTDALRSYVAGLKSGNPDTHSFNALAHDLLAAHTPADESGRTSSEPEPEETPKHDPSESPQDEPPADSPRPKGFDTSLLEMIRERTDGVHVAIVGRVHFEANLPLVGLKAELVYEKLARLGEVVYCDPPVCQVSLIVLVS